MADKYLVQAERLIAAEPYGAALAVMDRIVALQREHDLALPEEFHFTYARAALWAGSIKTAMDSVNRYLSAAGREGEYYREALALLVKAEGRLLAPEMVEIPAGRFQMGRVSGGCQDSEKPVHEVRIASFALSKTEVTFEEYDHFTAATGRKRAEDEGWGRGRRPVINVSWSDAVAYAEWLSAQAGESYRLPSEAEWEYAARAGSVTAYHFGNDASLLCGYGNHADTSTDYEWRNTACSDGVGKRTATVGTYQPNAFGLYDMHGNVFEWVQDCWNESYKVAPTDRALRVEGPATVNEGTKALRLHRRTARPGRAATVANACCAAVPGAPARAAWVSSAPRTATGSPPAVGARTTVSVWPGRSPLESLPLYLGGPRGLAPWWFFSV